MKKYCLVLLVSTLFACGKTDHAQRVEFITNQYRQDSLFNSLIAVTGNQLTGTLKDSTAFLVLPLEASCPSCRKKTIDSILKHKNSLPENHFIVIVSSGGRKIIKSYFTEHGDGQWPLVPGKLFYDSANLAFRNDLYDNNPCVYYAYDRKVYKKVTAIPQTVRNDLHEFFTAN